MEKRRILLEWHNDVGLNKGVTKRKAPWDYFILRKLADMKIAGKTENHFKRMRNREYIFDLLKYPELALKLIEKYS